MPSSLCDLEKRKSRKSKVFRRKENIWLDKLQTIVDVGCVRCLKLKAAMIEEEEKRFKKLKNSSQSARLMDELQFGSLNLVVLEKRVWAACRAHVTLLLRCADPWIL